jgi:sporulation protein YlmC with PRC-barrel domain
LVLAGRPFACQQWFKRAITLKSEKGSEMEMFGVNLKEGSGVFSLDGQQIGRVSRLVLDPATEELTHLVVETMGAAAERVVPFEMVHGTTQDQVIFNRDKAELDRLPLFDEAYFVRVNDRDGSNMDQETGAYPSDQAAPAYFWYPPHGHPGFPAYGLGHQPWPPAAKKPDMPMEIVPMREKTNVISSDGKYVGDVELLFLEPDSDQVTHFLLSPGVLLNTRKLVPAGWIKNADEQVHLIVPSDVLERLPAYKL